MREFVKACKALSDETRLRILHLLMERDCCVYEVMRALEISQTRASRNLSALYDAGFLKLSRDGARCRYSIDRGELKRYSVDLLEAVDKALEGNKAVLLDRQRLGSATESVRRRMDRSSD
jgi:ArsR family transcriptional regulator